MWLSFKVFFNQLQLLLDKMNDLFKTYFKQEMNAELETRAQQAELESGFGMRR